jgi:nicotinamide mononucleotide adenylyltransferase
MSASTVDSGTQTPDMLLEQQDPMLSATETPYTFPTDKLKRRQTEPGKTPLVLVACGSFSRKQSPPSRLTQHIPRLTN